MEIKLRQKGQIVTVVGFSSLPTELTPPAGIEGVDLTAYAVIYAGFGRHGVEKAKELHARTNVIVVYKYEWRNGYGEGVLLPTQFNPSKVLFYKSAKQKEKEKEEAIAIAIENLREEVSKITSDVKVCLHYGHNGVVLSPNQETFSSDWNIYIKSLEEARTEIKKNLPLWKEWNDRVLSIFTFRGIENPGKGNIELVFRRYPYGNERVGVSYYKKDDYGSYYQSWIILEKKNGYVDVGCEFAGNNITANL
jgi:hypothetical protein